MVGRARFELATNGLKVRLSAVSGQLSGRCIYPLWPRFGPSLPAYPMLFFRFLVATVIINVEVLARRAQRLMAKIVPN